MEEKKQGISEDWLSLWLGLFIFVLSLLAFGGPDLLGWGIAIKPWTDVSKATSATTKNYLEVKGEITKIDGQKVTLKKADGKEETITVKDATGLKVGDKYETGISGFTSLLLTYLFMLVVMMVGAAALRLNIGKFIVGFTIVFWLSYGCWLIGHYAYIAATDAKKAGIPWSLKLTGEAGFIVALIAGLIVGNFFPKLSEYLKDVVRPELYIKTAIVLMGALLGVKAAESFGLATAVMFRGLCAIIEAYLIYWALVYFIARKYFKFSKEWAAPLASGISICGVSAAIATGGAIRARPVVPIMVSSLVVIFAVIELVVLPFMAQTFLWQEPLVAGAWMGLAVKTDGAAVASGAVTDALVRAKAMAMEGVNYKEGWLTMTATTVKLFIDIFIGVWAFILAYIWCAKIECRPGEKIGAGEIWNRFPKFVLGYAITFFLLLIMCLPATRAVQPVEKEIGPLKEEIAKSEKLLPTATDPAVLAALNEKINAAKDKIKGLEGQIKESRTTLTNAKIATDGSNAFRVIFFVLTFFTIGVVSNFKKLWEEGIGKLAAVYILCLFGFIIWIGLVISWIFFHGVKPPIVTG
ncbi:MAG TPA: putative sulfate exporter family transporter [Thermodesulfovibrionales bacterium]|nr:putative sulfate exporter family transporter [Thermodesulfovibrionales bacterium]